MHHLEFVTTYDGGCRGTFEQILQPTVATFYTKYRYNFWRPETAILNAAADRNDRTQPDAAFRRLIVTPCFPSYPSAHGTLSNAARAMLEQVYGDGPFSITLMNNGTTSKYTSLTDITGDISDARVYGGSTSARTRTLANRWEFASANTCTRTICGRRMATVLINDSR